MKDWMFVALIYSLFALVFVVRHAILQNNKKKKEEKELVAKFLRDIFPESATSVDIADYTAFSFFKVSDILRELIKEKRVQEGEFGFISTELGNKHYPPKLRLISSN